MKVAVLGAGLQGVCVALELARRGVSVDLLDRDDRPLNRASLRNEGKIHLGLVYAKDTSLETADAMLDGALRFRRLVSGWTGGLFDGVARSRPFFYLAARDSLVTPHELASHYDRVQQRYRERTAADRSLDYLGERPATLWRPVELAEMRDVTSSELVSTAFATMEVAIDLPSTAELLCRAIAQSAAIRFRPRHRVIAVRRIASGFRVEGTETESSWALDCDQVVNALWDGRLRIDADLGLRPRQAWSHRLKYRVLVDLPPALHERPSATFVLGAYGDVVIHPGGRGYVSWYPECMQGWSDDLVPPASWDGPCRGAVAEGYATDLAARVLGAADPWFPGLAEARPFAVDAGTIFAFGETDITDPSSRLHRRDGMGVRSVDGYHSINTGKLTTAPVFAVDAADAVTGSRPVYRDDAFH